MGYTGKLKKSALYIGTEEDNSELLPGINGQILSLVAGELTWVNPPSGSGVSLSPYIVGPTNSDFTVIQDAIDQAVLDGASENNQINIYIKPNGGANYIEDLTLSDGINLIGLDSGNIIDQAATLPPLININSSVVIEGSITVSGKCKVINLQIVDSSSSNECIIFNEGVLYLKNIFILNRQAVTSKSFISFKTTNNKSLITDGLVTSGTYPLNNSLYVTDGSDCEIKIDSTNSKDNLIGESIFNGGNCQVRYKCKNSVCTNNLKVNCIGFYLDYINNECYQTMLISYLLSVNNISCIGYGNFYNCVFVKGSSPRLFFNQSVDFSILYSNCIGDFYDPSFHVNYQKYQSIFFISDTLSSGQGGDLIYGGPRVGFKRSNHLTSQRFVQTIDDTPTVLASVFIGPSGISSSCTLKGTITASTPDHVDMVGGDFLICAKKILSTGSVVGVPDITIKSTSSALFNVSVSGQSIQIIVTGEASKTYNWATTFSYQPLIDDQ